MNMKQVTNHRKMESILFRKFKNSKKDLIFNGILNQNYMLQETELTLHSNSFSHIQKISQLKKCILYWTLFLEYLFKKRLLLVEENLQETLNRISYNL